MKQRRGLLSMVAVFGLALFMVGLQDTKATFVIPHGLKCNGSSISAVP